MAHFLFVDESGYDAGESPYGVLAGIGVEDRDLWSLVKDIRVAERNHFGGVQYSGGERELRAKKLLKRKVFRQAAAFDPFAPEQRAVLARECLERGDRAGARQITALAQAKIAYVMELMDICARFRCKAFASVVSKTSPPPSRDHLRKDYAYLFERFFYYLEDVGPLRTGSSCSMSLRRSRATSWLSKWIGTSSSRRGSSAVQPDSARTTVRP